MATEPTRETAGVGLGEYLGRVVTGDCLEAMRGMPDGCCSAVVADPPYGTGGYAREAEGLGKDPQAAFDAILSREEWDEWSVEWLQEALRIAPTVVTFLPQVRIAEVWHLRQPARLLFWAKPDPRPAFSIMHAFEPIVAFGPLQGVYTMDYMLHTAIKPRRNAEALGHPHQKPLDVMRWLVRIACPDGGTILDPFAGSGSTGEAALREGREFIGIELDPHWAEVANARIAHARATHQPALPL